MPWSVARIEKELLLSNIDVLALRPDEAVAALKRAERVLGSDWIDTAISTYGRGIAPTMQLIGMGIHLASVDDLAGNDDLIKHLRRRDQDAESELTAIHLIRSCGPAVQLELHPAVGTRRADFQVRLSDDEHW